MPVIQNVMTGLLPWPALAAFVTFSRHAMPMCPRRQYTSAIQVLRPASVSDGRLNQIQGTAALIETESSSIAKESWQNKTLQPPSVYISMYGPVTVYLSLWARDILQ